MFKGGGGTKGIASAGPMGGGMGGLLGMVGKALAPLAALALILESSKLLQGTLKKIMTLVSQIIQPIGDIISVGLQPIIGILRPIGIYYRTLMQPYIKKAMEAMNVGNKLARTGDAGGAASAYALGIGFLLKPQFDMIVAGMTLAIEGILYGIKALGSLMIDVFSPVLNLFGMMPDTAKTIKTMWEGSMDSLITWTGNMGKSVIKATDNAMASQLSILKQSAIDANTEWKSIQSAGNTGMKNLKGEVETGFTAILTAMTDIMTGKKNEISGGGGGGTLVSMNSNYGIAPHYDAGKLTQDPKTGWWYAEG